MSPDILLLFSKCSLLFSNCTLKKSSIFLLLLLDRCRTFLGSLKNKFLKFVFPVLCYLISWEFFEAVLKCLVLLYCCLGILEWGQVVKQLCVPKGVWLSQLVSWKQNGSSFIGPFLAGTLISPEKDPSLFLLEPLSPIGSVLGRKWGWKAYCLSVLPGQPDLQRLAPI